jgi:hypothetical protein
VISRVISAISILSIIHGVCFAFVKVGPCGLTSGGDCTTGFTVTVWKHTGSTCVIEVQRGAGVPEFHNVPCNSDDTVFDDDGTCVYAINTSALTWGSTSDCAQISVSGYAL